MRKDKRISARITEAASKKLEQIAATHKVSISEAIVRSVEAFKNPTIASKDAAIILSKSGFIGCASADPSLSLNYKNYLANSLERKHDTAPKKAKRK